MDIFERLLEVDRKYVSSFSTEYVCSDGIIYHDDKLPHELHNYMEVLKYDDELPLKYGVSVFKSIKMPKGVEIALTCLHMISEVNHLNIPKNDGRVALARDNPDDFLRLIYISYLGLGVEYAKRAALRYYDVAIEKGLNDYYLVYEDDTPIGYISAFMDDDILKLEDFTISKSKRGMGYGGKLISNVLCRYDFKYAYICADKYDYPKNIYEKWGFVSVGETYFIRK